MINLARRWVVPLAFVLVSLALNRELLPHVDSALPGNAGDPMLNAWILGWVSQAVLADPGQLWHAPIFHPHLNALAMSEHLFGIALFVAPVYWATGNAVLAYNVAFLAGFAFLGWATFVLGRSITSRADAAFVAGLAVMCSPYFVGSQSARLQMLSAGWSLLALHWQRQWFAAGQRRALAALVVCWTVQFLSNLYLGVFLAVPVAILTLHAGLGLDAASLRRRLAPLAAAVIVVGVLAAPILLKYRHAQAELGLQHSADEVQRYSASLRSYASVISDHHAAWLWRETSSDRALFPGELLAVLAGAGAVSLLRQRRSRAGTDPSALAFLTMVPVVVALTLGPELSVAGESTGIPGPFALLSWAMPGFDGVRAPGRLAIFAILACAVLASAGAASLLRRCSASMRAALVAAAVLVAVWTGHRPYDWIYTFAAEDPSATAAYDWLAAQPKGVLVELPVVGAFQARGRNAGSSVTLLYQLASLRHGHRLVNGSSGFDLPLMSLLQSAASPFARFDSVDDGLRALRALGTRYLVIHRHEYRPEVLPFVDTVQHALSEETGQVESRVDFGTTSVYTLRPDARVGPPLRRVRVKADAFAVTTSHSTESAVKIADGKLDSRWMGPQHGRTWVQIGLHRTTRLSGIKFASPKSGVGHYPINLRVVGTDVAGARHVLFEGPTVYHALVTAALEPREPGVRITWPSRELTDLRLEQTGYGGDIQWGIYEMHLLEEPPAN